MSHLVSNLTSLTKLARYDDLDDEKTNNKIYDKKYISVALNYLEKSKRAVHIALLVANKLKNQKLSKKNSEWRGCNVLGTETIQTPYGVIPTPVSFTKAVQHSYGFLDDDKLCVDLMSCDLWYLM